MLGDEHPKEELNIIKQRKHYGWPYCYESQIFDKNFGLTFDCSKTEASAYTFTAHMAPLGLTFYREGPTQTLYEQCVYRISRFLESIGPSWLQSSTLKT